MVRVGRAAVELLLWLGVICGVTLLLVWWDVRPGAPGAEVAASGLPSRALLHGSFLLVTAATTLVIWLRGQLPLARLSTPVAGLALLLAGGPWSDIDDAAYVAWALRAAGIVLLLLAAATQLWSPAATGRRLSWRVAVGLLVLLLLPVGYGVLAIAAGVDAGMVNVQNEDDPGWVLAIPGCAVLALALSCVTWVVRSAAGDRVGQVTKNGA